MGPFRTTPLTYLLSLTVTAPMTEPSFAGALVLDTFDDLFAAVQAHARGEGWPVVKMHACGCRADGNYYRYNLACDHGINTHKIRSTGRRLASSRKEGCP